MPSPLCKTIGIATRIAPFSETSSIVTWITQDHGRLATLMKGIYRPRNPLSSGCTLLGTSELIFYRSALPGVAHAAHSCDVIDARLGLRSDWRAATTALYLADLATRLSISESTQYDLYTLLDESLDLLSSGATPHQLLWAELRFLERVGQAPQVNHCAGCRAALVPGLAAPVFAPVSGGLFCHRCALSRATEGAPAPADALFTLQAIARFQARPPAAGTRFSDASIDPAQKFIGAFINHHLDLPSEPRSVAYAALGWASPDRSTSHP